MATRILVVDDSPTIRSVVSTILERNGYEPKVATGGEDAYAALASGEVKADLVLVDFVMPKMNGSEFCRALRNNADLASTPVVLMSAKADRIRDRFVQETGAVDSIAKPFDAQALVAVIENALRKLTNGRPSSARLPDADGDNFPRSRIPWMNIGVENETRRTHIAQVVAQKLAGIAARTIAERPEGDSTNLAARIAARLTNEAIVEIMEVLTDMRRGDTTALLSGDLGVVPIGAVLQLLQSENQTGVLVCSSGPGQRHGEPGGAEVRATFRGGVIDLVQSTGAGDEFRLGRFFIDEGILTPAEIEAMTKPAVTTDWATVAGGPTTAPEASPTAPVETVVPPAQTLPPAETVPPTPAVSAGRERRPLGMELLAAGKIVESQLRTALTRQSSELLYEVLRWHTGRFELRREAPSELAENAKLGLPVASVVMEGFRRVDEWRVLERSLGTFDAVLVRDDAALGSLDVASLPPKEKAVLDLVDASRTVREIVSASHQSSWDVCRILVQFLEARVLRQRRA